MTATAEEYRQRWAEIMLAETVRLFHKTRKTRKGKQLPLADLARHCANTVFSQHQNTIVGDKELAAKAFMRACREGLAPELQRAIADITQQTVARVH
jgi:hypothetical protein